MTLTDRGGKPALVVNAKSVEERKGARAMITIKLNGGQIKESKDDHTPVDVAMWYDRRLRMWTLYPVDADGNQLRQASYAPRKDLAQILKKDIWDEIESGERTNWYY